MLINRNAPIPSMDQVAEALRKDGYKLAIKSSEYGSRRSIYHKSCHYFQLIPQATIVDSMLQIRQLMGIVGDSSPALKKLMEKVGPFKHD